MGLCHGTAKFCALLYWLVPTMTTYGNLPVFMAVLLLLLLGIILGLYPALFCRLTAAAKPGPLTALILCPALWASLEYLRGILLTGFPWMLLAHSQYRILPIIQMADITGVTGISALLVLGNTAAAVIWSAFRKDAWFGVSVSPRRAAACALIALAAAGVALGYGKYRISETDRAVRTAPRLRAAIVQGNIDQFMKWDPAWQKASLDILRNLTLSLPEAEIPDNAGAPENPDHPGIIIWPETAAAFYFGFNGKLTETVLSTAMEAGSHILTGAPATDMGPDGERRYFNSAFMITPAGTVSGRYDKVHLVPYGEYVPLKRFFPFVQKMAGLAGDFTTGKKGDILPHPAGSTGPLICYEVIFPDLARAAVNNGAVLLLNITNDAWYGATSAPYQHLSMGVFRAVENRRALARAANTGISAVIDPAGRFLLQTPLFTETAAGHPVPLLSETTIYTRFGDAFAFTCMALCAILGCLRYRRSMARGA